jgi:tetratricopeptide (TPR) repeat protein
VYKVCGNYANEIVKLVPELAERLGQVPPPVAADPDQARLRFYEGITQFFGNVAQEAPLLLFFDDLHWGDAPTLRLFAYAARGLRDRPVLMVGAHESPDENEEGPLEELLRDLRRDRLLEAVTLSRFSAEQVGKLAAELFGEAEISEEFRQLLFERTGGNPFYLTETLRSLVDEGMIYRTAEGRWERKEIAEIQIPKTVRDAIRERFNRLDKPVQETLRTASVLGTTFSAEVLRALVNLEEEALIGHLERAVEARIIREEPSSSRALDFSFTDSHVRDLLYGEMLAIRRARYHRQAAEAIEKLANGRTEAVAADLAHHYREGHEAEKARHYSVVAGDSAKNVFAFEDAERQYAVALELLRELPDVGLEAHVLESLGEIHRAQGRQHLTVSEWDSAIRLFSQAGNPRRAGALCTPLADLLRLNPELIATTSRPVDDVLETGRRLLEAAPPSQELAELYDMYAVWLVDQGKFPAAREMLERALRLARELGNKHLEMAMVDEFAMVAPIEEKEQVIDRLLAKVEYFSRPETFDLTQYQWAASNLSTAFLNVRSDAERAISWAQKCVDAAQRMHNLSDEIRARLVYLSASLLWAGDLKGAEQQVKRGWEISSRSGKLHQLTLERVQARLDLMRGDLASARRHIEAALEVTRQDKAGSKRHIVIILDTAAEVHLEAGRVDVAVQVLREAVEESRAEGRTALRLGPFIARLAMLAEALLVQAEGEGPLEEAEHLGREVHELATALGNPYVRGVDLRLQARLLHRATRSSEAVQRIEESVPLFEKSGNRLELGRTLRLKALLLRDLAESERAAASFQAALEVFSAIGASSEVERVQSESGGVRPRASTSSPVESG